MEGYIQGCQAQGFIVIVSIFGMLHVLDRNDGVSVLQRSWLVLDLFVRITIISV